MQLDDALRIYIEQNARITSKQTGRRYRTTTNSLTRFLRRTATTDDLTADVYGRWIAWRRRHVTPGTVRGDAEKLLAIWRWLAVRGLSSSPDVQLPGKIYRTPKTFSDAEMAKLWQASRQSPWSVGTVPGKVFWPALVSVLYETAERITPVLSSEWSHYDLLRGYVTFPAESRKGGLDDSVKPLGKATCHALVRLEAYTAGCRPFGERTPATVRKRFEQLLREAGIEHSRRKKFHGLRSRAATDIAAAGGNASLHLGHRDPRTTADHYIDPAIAQDRKTLRFLYRWQKRKWLPWLGW